MEPVAIELYAQAVGRDLDVDLPSAQYFTVGSVDGELGVAELNGIGQSRLLGSSPYGDGYRSSS